MSRVIFIVGPTAVGKSDLAKHLATSFHCEVVNADSRQVYRFMDIGTAKPTPEQRKGVPHYLLDILDPDQEFSLVLFLELARKAIDEIHDRNRLPIVVGGTGQYVRALMEGWKVPRVPADPSLRRKLEDEAQEKGAYAVHQRFAAIDPKTAAEIDPRNLRRIIRALETYHATGLPPSQTRRRGPAPYQQLVIGLTAPRQELYRRIDERVECMMAMGLEEEVRRLLEHGYSPDLPSMSSLGYKETVLYIKGQMSRDETVKRIKYETHRFARHQYAWFRLKDPRINWLKVEPGATQQAEEQVGAFLRQHTPVVE